MPAVTAVATVSIRFPAPAAPTICPPTTRPLAASTINFVHMRPASVIYPARVDVSTTCPRISMPISAASRSDSPVRATSAPQIRVIAVPTTPGNEASRPQTFSPATRPALFAIVPKW